MEHLEQVPDRRVQGGVLRRKDAASGFRPHVLVFGAQCLVFVGFRVSKMPPPDSAPIS